MKRRNKKFALNVVSEVVHSVNIMIAILLVGVCVTIYWIFKYDDWNPNPIIIDDEPSESVGETTTLLGYIT